MLRSMTGFGAAASAGRDAQHMRVEVRSVNHRHLALKLRLPEAFSALEPEVESRVRARCERGSILVHVAAERASGAAAVHLDRECARRWRDELGALAKTLALSPDVSLETLVSLPGVVTEADADTDEEALHAAALALVDAALERMLAMRAAEGQALAADLRKHAQALEELVGRIETRMPEVVKAQHVALAKRVEDLLGGKTQGVHLAPGDLARELALLADKLDVSEELARLASHLGQLETLVAKGGRAGRPLDFLVQEIFREVNTIGSKCSDATVKHWVVEAKTLVERLREQVQNVE
jgi:uncharacterized protein (TIGR00255 family)